MVKIFLDTANIDEIREAASWGVLDGVTTNPTLVARTGRKWGEVIQDVLALVDGPISLEVTTTEAEEMIKQGRQLAKVQGRGGFPGQLLRGHEALGDPLRIAEFLPGLEADRVQDIEAGLRVATRRKRLDPAPL